MLIVSQAQSASIHNPPLDPPAVRVRKVSVKISDLTAILETVFPSVPAQPTNMQRCDAACDKKDLWHTRLVDESRKRAKKMTHRSLWRHHLMSCLEDFLYSSTSSLLECNCQHQDRVSNATEYQVFQKKVLKDAEEMRAIGFELQDESIQDAELLEGVYLAFCDTKPKRAGDHENKTLIPHSTNRCDGEYFFKNWEVMIRDYQALCAEQKADLMVLKDLPHQDGGADFVSGINEEFDDYLQHVAGKAALMQTLYEKTNWFMQKHKVFALKGLKSQLKLNLSGQSKPSAPPPTYPKPKRLQSKCPQPIYAVPWIAGESVA